MSSKFAPPEQSDGDSLLKFAEMEINVIEMVDKNGRPYLKFSFVMTPADPTRPIQTRDFAAFDPGYRAVTWPSINAQVTAGTITAPDDLFTEAGQRAKKFLAGYKTPKTFFVATRKDIEYAQQNGAIQDFEKNAAGQYMKPHWPIQIVHIYNDRDQWAADAQAAPQPTAYQPAAPAPVQTAPVPDIERGVVLGQLNFFVKSSGLDLGRLEMMLSKDPFRKYFTVNSKEVWLIFAQESVAKFGTGTPELAEFFDGLNGYLAPLDNLLINPSLPKSFDINDPQIRWQVAQQIVAKHDSVKTEVAKFLEGLNGYLTMESREIIDNLEEVPF